jgi:hypothetical protein
MIKDAIIRVEGKRKFVWIVNFAPGDRFLDRDGEEIVAEKCEIFAGTILLFGKGGSSGRKQINNFHVTSRKDGKPLIIGLGEIPYEVPQLQNQHIDVKQMGVDYKGIETDDSTLWERKYQYMAVKCNFGHWHQKQDDEK